MTTAQAVFKAIENRNLKAFRKAIAGHADVSALRARDGDTVLRHAMSMRADDIALELIDGGIKVRPEEADLLWAVLVRRPDLVRRFIKLGGDVNAKCQMGTPLSMAAGPPASMRPGPDQDLLEIMRVLIEAGADLNAGGTRGALWSPLGKAVLKGRRDAAMLLLEAGARVDDPAELAQIARDGGHPELGQEVRAAASRRRKRPPAKPRSPLKPSTDPEVAKLESLCGTKARPLRGIAGAVALHVGSRHRLDLAKAQAAFLKRGRFVFATESDQTGVAMMKTRDPYDAIAAIGTNGDSHEVSNADVIAWLRELEKTHPFTITGIGFDFVMGRFHGRLKDPAGLARRMYAICPDVVNQGTGTLRALEAWLRKSRELYLWWD